MAKLLSKKELCILTIMDDARGGLYGLEIARKSEGAIGRGTVYVTLARLEQQRLVESQQAEKPPGHLAVHPHRFYSLTPKGRRVLRANESAIAMLEKANRD